MTMSRSAIAPSRSGPVLMLAFAILLVAMPRMSLAQDVPAFRQGLWEYQRAADGNTYGASECLDPGEELKRQQTTLQKIGCKLSPTTHAGSTWTYSADCTVKLPSGAMSFSKTSVLTADSDTAYQVETRTTGKTGTTSQVISAHRVADCTN